MVELKTRRYERLTTRQLLLLWLIVLLVAVSLWVVPSPIVVR